MDDPTLRLIDDRERIGHAILHLAAARDKAPGIALRFIDGTFLNVDGRRGRARHVFATEAIGDAPCRDFRIMPNVTTHIREAEIVTFLDADGGILGTLAWEGIRVRPASGAGARLGAGGGRPRTRLESSAPVFAAHPTVTAVPIASPATMPTPVGRDGPPAPRAEPRRRRHLVVVSLGVGSIVLAALAFAGCIMAGLVGWRLDPVEVAFSGPAGGPFAPRDRRVRLVLAWYAEPFLGAAPVPARAAPDWLDVGQTRSATGWSIVLSSTAAAVTLQPGRHEARLPLAFPLRIVSNAVAVSLVIETLAVLAPKVAETPPRPPAPSTIDDAACDRLAGNRFDSDRPPAAGFTEEIFDLSQADLDAGLAACDPSLARSGPDRRFVVQRGRLLAHRALLRLAAGDVPAATADMDEAVALWRHGDSVGSAYAANLLGAFHDGTFNRPGHAFVAPDEGMADIFWKRAADHGNVVGERNYAAQLLAGKGVPADPAHAIVLLRDASGKGDLRASAILGVALFTGMPPGITGDKAAGWPLVVAAQCIDKSAASLLDRTIATGAEPSSARRLCR